MARSARRATLDDLDLLVAHRRGMFHDMGSGDASALDAADPVYRRWIRQRLRSGQAVAWVAGGGAASGVVWLKPIQPRPSQRGLVMPYLMSMYTTPEARGRGHATRIVKAALAWCKKEGYARLDLHASPYGRPIYEKLGFDPAPEMRYVIRRSSRASTTRSGSR